MSSNKLAVWSLAKVCVGSSCFLVPLAGSGGFGMYSEVYWVALLWVGFPVVGFFMMIPFDFLFFLLYVSLV